VGWAIDFDQSGNRHHGAKLIYCRFVGPFQVVVADDEAVFVTSANLTEAALSRKNIEDYGMADVRSGIASHF
jgi:hypothetical protein